ncbi:MAG: hypothetical protein H0T04_06895 [Chloroflexi bacterium]|nr:hypothetical protein [Chloroflexota bacterium]
MSRAERYALPEAPRLGGAVRSAAVDLYFNSWRLVPANAIWGLLLLITVAVAVYWFVGAVLLLVVLAIPTAGIYRLAALIARGDAAAFSDAVEAYRRYLRRALLLGLIGTVGTTVLGINILTGLLTLGGPLGWAIATAAAWGLVIFWAWLLCLWPLVVDPRREGASLREQMRLAALLVLALPLRIGVLLMATALLLALSTVLFAALITITLAYCALLGCRYVLPAADRLEGRATVLIPDL